MYTIKIKRIFDSGKSTVGLLSTPQRFYITLEDSHQPVKVRGKTRITAGKYQIKFRKVLSKMTQKYQKKFDWFTWHLELQEVPNFKYVYIHIGNYPTDTDGCILVANVLDCRNADTISNSTEAFKELYLDISKRLKNREKVFIEIID